MNAERLQTTTSSDGDAASIELAGELDIATVDGLKADLEQVLAAGPASIAIDLAGLVFIDSTGLGAFVEFQHRCDDQSVPVVFRQVPDQVRRLMEITRLTELFRLE